MQQQLQRLADHLAATQPEVLPVLLPAEEAGAIAAAAAAAQVRVAGKTGQGSSAGALPPLPVRVGMDATGADTRVRECCAAGLGFCVLQAAGASAAPVGASAVQRSALEELQRAVEASETAVAVTQSRLLDALQVRGQGGVGRGGRACQGWGATRCRAFVLPEHRRNQA